MKTALVIGGGGSKGAFAVGAIEVLREQGIKFDIVAGTSTGALLAPMVALNDLDGMIEHYTKVRTRDILRKNWRGLFWKGLYHARPLKKRVSRWVDENYEKLMSCDVQVILCAISLQGKKALYFSQKDSAGIVGWGTKERLVQSIMGSAVQPFLMPPEDMEDEQLVDGGVREIAPLDVVIKNGADKVFVIVHSTVSPPASTARYRNLFSIGIRTLDMMLDEIILNDVRLTYCYNKSLGAGAVFASKNHIDLTMIRPTDPLPAAGLSFDPVVMQKMRVLGQQAARQALAST